MNVIKSYLNRTLRNQVLPSGEKKGMPGYYAFTHGEQPAWWRPEMDPQQGEVLGIYESFQGSPTDALIITQDALVVLEDSLQKVLRYKDIAGFHRVCKEPLDEEFRVELYSGDVFSVPFRARDGAIMDIYRFLIFARTRNQGIPVPGSRDSKEP
ncbi:hypothetical protein [Polyangium sorediatum]|uniref:Uncharacterized protein n=1 Tax=Polyangium sorediatum TaxID=889274 RepID=A0ABT6NYF1_9BACT|nr:hypothetical protein [Polyangium sorediatum]MDI1433323.1 hypothetical protein [Polyangium sorediatum]